MPLVRRSMEEAAVLSANLLKAFERDVADTQLLMVPQVTATRRLGWVCIQHAAAAANQHRQGVRVRWLLGPSMQAFRVNLNV